MTTINLKNFYPWYTHDEYIEVSEEVADELRASRLYEAAYQRRIVRNKAQYSLIVQDGIGILRLRFRTHPAGAAGAHGAVLPSVRCAQSLCPKRRAAGWTPV